MNPTHNLYSLIGNYDKLFYMDSNSKEEPFTDLTELGIIIGKSLVNDKKEEKLWVDVARLKEELILWKYYRQGNIDCFLLNEKNKSNPPLENTGIISLLPLILGNYDFEKLEQEIYTFVYKTNQAFSRLMLFLLMGKATYVVQHQHYNSPEAFIQLLKDYLIHLNYERISQPDPDGRTEIISFEREKVRWIMDLDRMLLNELPKGNSSEDASKILFIQSIHLFLKYHDKQVAIEEIQGYEIPREAKVFRMLLMDLKNRNKEYYLAGSEGRNALKSESDNFLKVMDRYYSKLIRFEILKASSREKNLNKQDCYSTKMLFLMKQGEKGRHPLLGDFEITEKKVLKKCLLLEVKTKSRKYKLKKPLAQG